VSKNYADITIGPITNRFYLFGGKDESSASLIQGMTLAGVLLDEIALMPRSFVEQAIARCSVPNSKLWFNCNPANPYHWFYREWIKNAETKNILYAHFTMDDNPSLTEEVKERYKKLFAGAFYDRYILGKWVNSSGLIYPMFNEEKHVVKNIPKREEMTRFIISGDYGTVNPSSFGLWGYCAVENVWYRLREYYYNSREEGVSRTDEEHYEGLCRLAGSLMGSFTAEFEYPIEKVIIDPSAASFIECIRRHGDFNVTPAKNDVLSGIRKVADALKEGKLKFHESCKASIREFNLYCWNEKSALDVPLKENDHAMDDIRYFTTFISNDTGEDDFFVSSLCR
jgi:PBSX family phage terminase large subunit